MCCIVLKYYYLCVRKREKKKICGEKSSGLQSPLLQQPSAFKKYSHE